MYNKPNNFQKIAVDIQENALVIACPGSGKTRVLILKIAKELEKLTHRNHRIAALTFTNRAADEVEKRISVLGIDLSKLWTGTIHSFCLQWIIRPYSIYINELKEGFSIIDEIKVEEIISELKDEYNIPTYTSINTKRDRAGNYLNGKEILDRIANEFHQKILKEKMIDFDLILYFSYFLLEKYPKISNHLSQIFKYFFIDEFQDTQDLQYAIVGKIIKRSNGTTNIFLVGDPDQAIFTSLGGVAKNELEISNETGGSTIHKLTLSGNYRSTQRIINFYKNFQSENIDIKSIAEYCNEQGIIAFDSQTDKNNLVDKIAKIIKCELEKGIPPNEICVLAPQWRFLTSTARSLKSILPDVPFDAPGLTIIPRYQNNFWYNLSRIILCSKGSNKYLIRMRWVRGVLEELNMLGDNFIEIDSKECRRFLKVINSISVEEIDTIQYLECAFEQIFDYLEIDLTANKVLLEQKEHFFTGIKKRYDSSEFENIPKDINYVKKIFNSSEGVIINTCQGVKGEEYHTVIAFGLLRGYVPHWNSIIDQPSYVEFEESNKLLYVIGSRAKKNLYLFAEKGRFTSTGNAYEINSQLNAVDFAYDKWEEF